MSARRRFELPSYGIDEFKQLNGSDPFGSNSWLGLRVPTKATTAIAAANTDKRIFANRFLFMGARFEIAEACRARIIGYRQLLEIGYVLNIPNSPGPGTNGPRPIILEVTTPGWTFTDQTVSWHFRRVGPPDNTPIGPRTPAPNPPGNIKNAIFRDSDTPALLWESMTLPAADTLYMDLTAYVPPNAGRPWGTPLTNDPRLSNVYGLQTPWRSARAWTSLDVEIQGPDTVVAFISVGQTDPVNRPELISVSPQAFGSGLAPEDAFILGAKNTLGLPASNLPIYWRVGVSLIVEVDSLVSEIRGVLSGDPV